MKNLWKNNESLSYIKYYKNFNVSKDLALRIYTTHLLGGEKELVLHGGGNTSVKTNYKNIFGEEDRVIYVKGSGWDMSNLTHKGMPGLNINPLLKTLSLNKLNDDNMVNYLRSNLIDSNAPNPSVETLLHAYLPHKYVDHTHSNAFLSLVNLENSKQLCQKLFKQKLGIVPYVMPGFELAKLCHKIYNNNTKIEGLVLLNHGIFTFGDSAKKSYDRMIKYVNIVENFIAKGKKNIKTIKIKKIKDSKKLVLSIRKTYNKINGSTWIIKLHNSKKDVKFSLFQNLDKLITKGPVTPDHVIRIKSKPLFIKSKDIDKIDNLILKYVKNYIRYFKKYKNNIRKSIITDPLPRIIVVQGIGFFSIGKNFQESKIS